MKTLQERKSLTRKTKKTNTTKRTKKNRKYLSGKKRRNRKSRRSARYAMAAAGAAALGAGIYMAYKKGQQPADFTSAHTIQSSFPTDSLSRTQKAGKAALAAQKRIKITNKINTNNLINLERRAKNLEHEGKKWAEARMRLSERKKSWW